MYEAIMNSHRKWVFCITFIKLYCLQGVAMLFSFEKRFSPDNAKFTTLSYFCNKPTFHRISDISEMSYIYLVLTGLSTIRECNIVLFPPSYLTISFTYTTGYTQNHT